MLSIITFVSDVEKISETLQSEKAIYILQKHKSCGNFGTPCTNRSPSLIFVPCQSYLKKKLKFKNECNFQSLWRSASEIRTRSLCLSFLASGKEWLWVLKAPIKTSQYANKYIFRATFILIIPKSFKGG